MLADLIDIWIKEKDLPLGRNRSYSHAIWGIINDDSFYWVLVCEGDHIVLNDGSYFGKTLNPTSPDFFNELEAFINEVLGDFDKWVKAIG